MNQCKTQEGHISNVLSVGLSNREMRVGEVLFLRMAEWAVRMQARFGLNSTPPCVIKQQGNTPHPPLFILHSFFCPTNLNRCHDSSRVI